MNPLVLAVTITRDGYANPSRRLPDKHTRLFHGKTLDEWWCIRCWSTKYISNFVMVGETEEHCARIRPMVESYGGEVVCRPRAHLHTLADTGGYPMRHGMRYMEAKHGEYNLCIQNFVVNPCYPPGLWDKAVERYMELAGDPELSKGFNALSLVYHPQDTFFQENFPNRGQVVGNITANTGKDSTRWATTDGCSIVSPEYLYYAWLRYFAGDWTVSYGGDQGIMIMPVPWWTNTHIDHDYEWDLASYCFEKYIGDGETAFRKYAEYRDSWLKEEKHEIPGPGDHG